MQGLHLIKDKNEENEENEENENENENENEENEENENENENKENKENKENESSKINILNKKKLNINRDPITMRLDEIIDNIKKERLGLLSPNKNLEKIKKSLDKTPSDELVLTDEIN